MQGHHHGQVASFWIGATALQGISGIGYSFALTSLGITGPTSDGSNGTPRTANETRPKNIGATYYMRIR